MAAFEEANDATAARPLELARAAKPAPDSLTQRLLLRWGVTPMLVVGDLIAVVAGGVVAVASLDRIAILAAAVLALQAKGGLYRSRLGLSVLADLPSLVGRALLATAVLGAYEAVLSPVPGQRLAFLVAGGFYLGVCVLLRTVGYEGVRRLRSRAYVSHPTVIVGAGIVGGEVAAVLLDHPEYGLRPVGFLDANPLLLTDERAVPLLGTPDLLASVVAERRISEVIVAFGSTASREMVDVVRTCDQIACQVFVVPRLFEMECASRRTDVDEIWGIPLHRLRRRARRSRVWRAKRAFDVALAGTALLLLSPLLCVIALAVTVELGPHPFFRQERIGQDSHRFGLLKFRTLNPVDNDESQTRWNVAADARIGLVGRFLRRTSLDELPQLWNILRGDMSIVGPRPERPHFAERFSADVPRYRDRHRVPSGLTGLAQVQGLRGDTSIRHRARFDNFYIENWSLWGDMTIVLRTLRELFRRGTY
jgi:exopolysaccharide biosynthesis polyprenyl glycosylphosphotransferase